MAIAFSRSMRSLKMDSFRFSVFGLVVAVVLLLAWMAWFFMARISLYEISKDGKLGEDGSLSAKFPAERLQMIQSGQSAIVQIEGKSLQNGNGGESGEDIAERTITAQAMVMKVQPVEKGDKQGLAELMLIDDYLTQEITLAAEGQPTAKMTVQVEIERVTPFALIQRAARQYFGAAPAPQTAAPAGGE